MSHLNAINRFKIDLIEQGIVSPYEQMEAVRMAYTCVLVRLINTYKIPEQNRMSVLKLLLGYWNETHPVDGNTVILEVNGFFERLDSYINNIVSKAVIPLTTKKDNVITHDDKESYKELIATLYNEAITKYEASKGE